MKKWVSILLTVMMLVNSFLTPVVALADDASTLSTGYAIGTKNVGIYNFDFDYIGTVEANGYFYVDDVINEWARVAFAVNGEVMEAYVYIASGNLANVEAEPSGAASYNGHPLSNVNYTVYVAADPTEVPAENEEVETPDEEVETPDEEVETPDEEVETPDEEVETPDEEVETPDEEVETPDEEVETPDEEVETPDEEVETPDEEVETPDEEVETPDEEVETPDEEVETPDEEVETPDEEVETPDEEVETPDEEVETPDEEVETPDEEVETPDEEVETPDEEVETPDEEVETPDEEVETPDEEVETPDEEVETPDEEVETPDEEVETPDEEVETPDEEVETPDEEVETPDEEVETPDEEVETPDEEVETPDEEVETPDEEVETPDEEVAEPEDEEPEEEVTEPAEEEVVETPAEEEVVETPAEEVVEEEIVEEEPVVEPVVLTKTIGGTRITVTGDTTTIPAGTELQVTSAPNVNAVLNSVINALAAQDMTLLSLTAYDITLLVDGEVVQPSANVKVSITDAPSGVSTFSIVSFNSNIAEEEDTKTFIFHVSDSGVAQNMGEVEGAKSTMVISVPHFSVYAKVVGEKRNKNLPDEIVSDKGYQAKNSRTVKVTWDEPVRDANGDIIYKVDKDGNPIYVYDENGNPVMEDAFDKDGKPLYDFYGNDQVDGSTWMEGESGWGYYKRAQQQKKEAVTEPKSADIDISSPAFDFHMFGDYLEWSKHTNGNFAGNRVNGSVDWGTNQHKGWDTGDTSYVGEDAGNGLPKGNGNGSIVVGSGVDVNGDSAQGTTVGGGTAQDEMTVYKEHKHTPECYTTKDGTSVLSCGMEESDPYIRIKEELEKLSGMSKDLADLADAKGLAKDLTLPADQNAKVEIKDDTKQEVIVLNINAKAYLESGRSKIEFNFPTTNKLIIINVDMTGVPQNSTFKWTTLVNGKGINSEDSAYDNNNVLWNFYERKSDGSKQTYSGNFKLDVDEGLMGTVLAPNASVDFGAVNGSVIAREAKHTGGESHFSPFTGGSISWTVYKKLVDEFNDGEQTFYFAAFEKQADDTWVRVSEVRRITLKNGEKKSGSIPINNYDSSKTYKIFETDAAGKIIASGDGKNSFAISGGNSGVGNNGTITNSKTTTGETPTPDADETPTPTPDDKETPTPTPDDKETPTPTPDDKETPTPTPDDKETPTPTPDDKETETPTPDEEETETPTPDEEETETPTPDEEETETPTPDEEETETPTPDEEETETPTPDEEETETPTPDEEETETPTPDEEETETPTPDEEETETPTPDEEETETPAPVVQLTMLTGTKTWVDNDNADGMRPDSIEIVLYANGVAQPNIPTWVKNGNVWTYSFTRLPVTNAFGVPIVYTVTETPVEYYTTTQDGFNFTNTIVPKDEIVKISVSGQKSWQDGDNAGNTRPASILITLLQNGVAIDSAVVTADANWAYTFADLPEGDGYGNAYNYTVHEQAVPGYYAVYDGMNVTNVLLPNTPNTPDLVTFNDQPVARGIPDFSLYTSSELAEMFEMFDYDVPLFGMLLGTGLEIPMYPFVFAGFGGLAIVLLIVFGRKKKED